MKELFDLSSIKWRLSGWTPEEWRLQQTVEIGADPHSVVPAFRVNVPCSVQKALRDIGRIKDWNEGLNFMESEWVEHRHWLYDVELPDDFFADKSRRYFLNCEGLDYAGDIFFNGEKIHSFANSYLPVKVELKDPRDKNNWLRIAFICTAPGWQGQFGTTSQMTAPKVRFYYSWDWTCRMVQTGIWDKIYLTSQDKTPFDFVSIDTDADWQNKKGMLDIKAEFEYPVDYTVEAELSQNGKAIKSEAKSFVGHSVSFSWQVPDIDLWHCNLNGEQPLYDLKVIAKDSDGSIVDTAVKRIGFKHAEWKQTEGAHEFAGKWLLELNGKPTFIQGVNWVPPYTNFADATREDYKALIDVYKDLGINLFRVWGGGVLEHEDFYDLCDEAGIMVWQEFPLSSSGVESEPPFDKSFIDCLQQVAVSYVKRRKHHIALTVWCGGNELACAKEIGDYKNANIYHPMLRGFMNVIKKYDPNRRFQDTTPSGMFLRMKDEIKGKGVLEDIHGPWRSDGTDEDWAKLFEDDESMFRAETGAPGCSGKDVIDAYAGDLKPEPIDYTNDYWCRPFTWWMEFGAFERQMGRKPESAEEYIDWSRERQAKLLVKAVGTYKKAFPRHGGFIIWMGHDCYPCTANTSIIDFFRHPKPAALALKEKVFRKNPEDIDI